MSNHDPFDPRSQERAKADADTRSKVERESEESDWKWLMASKRGRRMVWRLLQYTKVYESSFNSNSMTMAFNEGIRCFGTFVLKMVHASAYEMIQVMEKENRNERNHDDASHQSH